MSPMNWRSRQGAHTTGGRSPRTRNKQSRGGEDSRSGVRVGGRLPEYGTPERAGQPPETAARTQEYASDGYEPVHLNVRQEEPAAPAWADPPPWSEPAEWTRPTTPWNAPTGERWQTGGLKGRGRWRTAHMLFRRRYNTAAIVTIVAVSGVLFLLAAVPIGTHNRGTAAGGAATPVASAATKQATFQLDSYEAEAPGNTLIGSASVGPYARASGGQLVRAIGNWRSARGLGALRFNNIAVPKSGPYVMTFYFVNIGSLATRTAVITASGSQSSSVTVASDSNCCTAQPVVIFLFKGKNAITFSNSGAEAPAIDKITLKVPVS
jgi:hypothetical protein